MPAIPLTPKQEQLRKLIEGALAQLLQWQSRSPSDVQQKLDQLAAYSHELHMLLTEEGNEPRYSAQIRVKRGVKPEEPGFFRHMEAAEALLDFIDGRP